MKGNGVAGIWGNEDLERGDWKEWRKERLQSGYIVRERNKYKEKRKNENAFSLTLMILIICNSPNSANVQSFF